MPQIDRALVERLKEAVPVSTIITPDSVEYLQNIRRWSVTAEKPAVDS